MAGLFLCLSFMCVVPAGDLPTNRVHATPRAAPLKDWCLCPLELPPASMRGPWNKT